MSTLVKRLDAHFVACAAAAGAAMVGTTQNAEAGIVYSGVLNFSVPATTSGVYANMATFALPTAPGGGPELNLWGSGACNAWTYPNGNTQNRLVGTSTTLAARLAAGAPINAGSTFLTSATGGSGFGTNANWGLGTQGFLGYKFDIGGGNIRYGWAQVRINSAVGGTPMTLVDMAYEDTGGAINAGAVPAPGSLALLALGAVGLAGRRRK